MPWSYHFIHCTIYKQLKAKVTAYTEASKNQPILHCLHNKTEQTAVLVKYTTIKNLDCFVVVVFRKKLTLILQGCITLLKTNDSKDIYMSII